MENQSKPCKCPFRNPIITRDYHCECAQEVTFRDGPGVACSNTASWQRCTELFDALKTASLPAFEVSDDLTEMPASVIGKIQYGGLAALASMLEAQHASTDNINELVGLVLDTYSAVDKLDYGTIVPVIKDYRIRKRRKG